ncbi:MAG: hypothetical protein CSA15_05075, partial [Candidatus Delongbacteria bacterium]
LVGKVLEVAKKMLVDSTNILEENNIKYILEAGTLLGIVRENRLLPWDNDIDITVTEEYEKQVLALKWKFFWKGYRFRPKYYKIDVGPFKKGTLRIIKISTRKFFFFGGYRICDIFVKRTIESDRDNYYWSVGINKAILKSCPKRYYDEVKNMEFEGKSYLVPKDEIGYLEYHYGKDWQTPVKTWNFRTDDNCKQVEIGSIKKRK